MKLFLPKAAISALFLAVSLIASQAQPLWSVGRNDNAWPAGDGGGENASFVQENGSIQALPGRPDSPETDGQSDNDYYFAGDYSTTIQSVIDFYTDYTPVGFVEFNEESAERAFAAADNDLRYHFNLPENLQPTDLLSITFDALNLHVDATVSDPRYGIEVYFNGIKVQDEILIRPAQVNHAYTTPQFSLASVNAQVGAGFDNIVSLKGINYNTDGGGNWMGIDFVQLNPPSDPIPAPTFPWKVGKDDGGWPVGNGGGENASFVQENGVINPLPGNPASPETDQQADNDYYFGGLYDTLVNGNGTYTPVGLVPVNEEAAERAFAGGDNDLRYHFNLPNSLIPSDQVTISFEPLSLHTDQIPDPRYGVEVYFNGVRVQSQIVVRPPQLNKTITTPPFTLGSVNAQVGAGFDNIISLRGISYSSDGGGAWMGFDYVSLEKVAAPIPDPVLPWSVGKDDNDWPVGNGGGENASFVQENGVINPLPGNPASPETDQQADNDYYLAGSYTTIIQGNGTYIPVGAVPANEEAAERAFAGGDTELRYHFNLPAGLTPTDVLQVGFDALNLHTGDDVPDPRWGVEVYFNGVKVMDQVVIRTPQLGTTFTSPEFTLGAVNAQVGPGFDNILTLKGISYLAEGGGNWMGIDYITLAPKPRSPFPWTVGLDDNNWPAGNGGGANATFVQEAGTNPLPGNPRNPEVDQQGDDDYYFAGVYDNVIDGNGVYTPLGLVLSNEETAERAFAGTDNTKRYHFNLPENLGPDDLLAVTFDAFNLQEDAGIADPRYGVEIYFNGVKIQEEILIHHAELDVDYTTAPFTLASVNAQVGPGYDNIVTLQGISYSGDGGGAWMGIDYIRLDPVRSSPFPLAVGKDDDGWPVGDGGGENATFVQEAGTNPLPGRWNNREVDQQADDDYYFAGLYTTTIQGNGDYTPVGLVPVNEEAAERAFAGTDNDKRYHFNLPESLKPEDLLTVNFDMLNLHTGDDVPDPHYGVEVYFNGVLLQEQIVVRPADLGTDYATAPFSLASVSAQVGRGYDNIVTLRGINYNAEGGGNWMGIDYVQVNPVTTSLRFQPPQTAAGKVILSWTGTGRLEFAPTVLGPWNPVDPAPIGQSHAEDIDKARNRFYRLTAP